MTTGLVLFAHGARDTRWRQPLDRLLALVEPRHTGPVCLAFLEHMQPDLPTACAALARSGAKAIVVAPLFLGMGGHMRNDVPALVAAAERQAGVPVSIVPAAGEDAAVLHALAEYCLKATRT